MTAKKKKITLTAEFTVDENGMVTTPPADFSEDVSLGEAILALSGLLTGVIAELADGSSEEGKEEAIKNRIIDGVAEMMKDMSPVEVEV